MVTLAKTRCAFRLLLLLLTTATTVSTVALSSAIAQDLHGHALHAGAYRVSSGLPSLAALPVSQRMDILRSLINVMPEHFVHYVSEPGNRAAITGDERFLRCALAVGGLAKILSGQITDTNELQEIAASHGFDPNIAYDIAAGNREVGQVAMDIAATNEAAIYVSIGQKEKLLESEFYASKQQTSRLMRNIFGQVAGGLPFGMSEQLANQTVADFFMRLRQQSSVITSVLCPF